MARDRLADLKGAKWEQDVQNNNNNTNNASQSSRYPPNNINHNINSNNSIINVDVLKSPALDLQTFFKQQEVVSNLIESINNNIDSIRNLNQRSLQEVNQTQANNLKLQAEDLISQTQSQIDTTRNGLKILQKSRKGDPSTREGLYKTSLSNLQSSVRAFWSLQSEIKASSRDQIARQIRIARPGISDQEINDAIENGVAGGDVFASEILSSRVADSQRILGAVQDRQKALEKITKSMEELLQLVQELDSLINSHQPFIDEIESRVENTAVAMEQGVLELSKANDYAAAARKKKWIVFAIIIIVLIIIAAVIAIYVVTNKSK